MNACCDNTDTTRRTGWRRFLTGRIAIVVGLVAVAGGGLAVGGWGWLVAAGLAPIILSLLPCLVMCGLGLCMMGMNKSKSNAAPAIDAAIQNGEGTARRGDSMPSSAVPSIVHRQSQNVA
ncbi:hypothetical protein ACMS1Z_10425 [Acidiphilium multivorum]|uniref:hypothetical protein n=1 Tax=Acidiphilium multivorum TaxID=62140 RepID=UPI0039C953D2